MLKNHVQHTFRYCYTEDAIFAIFSISLVFLTKEVLKIANIVRVFNQPIYTIAMEMKWKEPQVWNIHHHVKDLGSCIIMLEIFHTIMMQLVIIYKCFGDGGLLDPLV